jgi:hypothetical protein
VLQALLDQHEREHETHLRGEQMLRGSQVLAHVALDAASQLLHLRGELHGEVIHEFVSVSVPLAPDAGGGGPGAAALVRGLRDVSGDVSMPGLRE